jgi:alginate O-acetyltransferase complex protein AlgJ
MKHWHIFGAIVMGACVAAVGAGRPAGAAESDIANAFAAESAAKAAAAERASAMAVAGREGWLFPVAELRHLAAGKFWGDAAAKVSRASKAEFADPLPAILDFKAQLDKAGIELVVVPVPGKSTIYPDMLSAAVTVAPGAAPPRVDAADQEFMEVLRGAGVRVVDLVPEFLAHRSGKEGQLFCKTDSHWSGNGCVVAARLIAAEIKDRPWLAAVPKISVVGVWRTADVAGDLAAPRTGKEPTPERVAIRFVGEKTGDDPEMIEANPKSPVVLLGDSSSLVFHAGADMHAVGAGLADQLTAELGFAMDLVAVQGSGTASARINLLRRSSSDPNYLKAKRLIIWCFVARDFTESQEWKKVPIAKEPKAANAKG